MSHLAQDWAETVKVYDVYERAVLTFFAHRAYDDGTDCFPSIATLARFCACDDRTVKRTLDRLQERHVIARGDQKAALRLPRHRRPVVWDLLIPYTWYNPEQMEKVTRLRKERGLPPLRPEDRPAIAAPKPKPKRSDKGKPNPNRRKKA